MSKITLCSLMPKMADGILGENSIRRTKVVAIKTLNRGTLKSTQQFKLVRSP